MTVSILEFKGFPSETIHTVIEKKEYIFRLRWNSLVSLWTLDISTAKNTPILMGIALFPPHNITRVYNVDKRLPQLGDIWCISTDNTEVRPEFNSINSTVHIAYIPHADIQALAIAEYY
jgi:hypothetical protein